MSLLLGVLGARSSPWPSALRRRAAGLRHLRGHDPAGHRRARRPRRPALLRGHRHHRPPQRLRPPGRLVRGRPRRGRPRRRAAATPCSSGPRWSSGPGRRSRCWPRCRAAGASPARPVVCRQGPVLVAAFHPELTGDRRLHRLFVADDRKRRGASAMSGHSKWATTKHQKGAKDAARAKVFAKLIRQVEVAAREGGSDMTANASLRTMYKKARDASVPIDTIERAIKRGSGELEGVRYESDLLRGLRPRRRGGDRRVPDRQPQPHRRRDPQPLLQERRLHGRAGRGQLAVRAQGRDRRAPRPSTRSGSSRWPWRPGPRTWPTRASGGWSPATPPT